MNDAKQEMVSNTEQLHRGGDTSPIRIPRTEVPNLWERNWTTGDTSSPRIFGTKYTENNVFRKIWPKYPESSPGNLERDLAREPNLLQERRGLDGNRYSDDTRQTKRPRRRSRPYQEWHYSPSTLAREIQDDDSTSQRNWEGVSETESESSTGTPNTSDREFLVESDDELDENASILGCSGCGENKFCACTTTESTDGESSGRSHEIRRGNPRRNYIRRHVIYTSSEDEPDTSSGSRIPTQYPLSLPNSNNISEHEEDIHNERRWGKVPSSGGWGSEKEN